MIPAPISVYSLPFAVIAFVLILSSRYKSGRLFPAALFFAGIVFLASWLTLRTSILLAASMIPTAIYLRFIRTRNFESVRWSIPFLVTWQIACLLLTKLGPLSQNLEIAGTVGLSYLTFRQIEVVIRARNYAAKNIHPFIYATYFINPLTLLAGPIQTFGSHEQGLATLTPPLAPEAINALQRLANGAIKVLVLAPLFRNQGSAALLPASGASAYEMVLTFYSYYIFLFLDFSGYMDLILSVAVLCGFRTVPENFNRPYLATNAQDFWNRWHITLGAWFRTFVFTPMQTYLMRNFPTLSANSAIALSLFTVFILIGLWHGLAWNYVLFGVLHATAVVGTYLTKAWATKKFGKSRVREYEASRSLLPLRILVCQHFICASFILLDNSLSDIWRHL